MSTPLSFREKENHLHKIIFTISGKEILAGRCPHKHERSSSTTRANVEWLISNIQYYYKKYLIIFMFNIQY